MSLCDTYRRLVDWRDADSDIEEIRVNKNPIVVLLPERKLKRGRENLHFHSFSMRTHCATKTSARETSSITKIAAVGGRIDVPIEITEKVMTGRSSSREVALRDTAEEVLDGRWAIVDYIVMPRGRCSETRQEES